MHQFRTSIVTRGCVAAVLVASALRAQTPVQTPMAAPLTPMDAAYVQYLQYLSLLTNSERATPSQPPTPGPTGALGTMTPAEVGEYLYRNGARALTVPAVGQPGSEYFSRGAELNTIPAPSSVFAPAAPSPTVSPSSSATPQLPPSAIGAAEIPAPAASTGLPASSPAVPGGSPSSPWSPAPFEAAEASLPGSAPSSVARMSTEPSGSSTAPLSAATADPQSPSTSTRSLDEERVRIKETPPPEAPFLADYDGMGEMMRGFAIGALAVMLWAATVLVIALGLKRRPSRDRARQEARSR